jgi:hypothetical protein
MLDDLVKSSSFGSVDQLLEHRSQFNLPFDSISLTALEIDPAFVEAIQHLHAGQWMAHPLGFEK